MPARVDFLCQRRDVSRSRVTVRGNFVITPRAGINLMLVRAVGELIIKCMLRGRFQVPTLVNSTVCPLCLIPIVCFIMLP